MKKLITTTLLLIITACSSIDQNLVSYRKALKEDRLEEAEAFLNKSKIKKDPDSQLLFLMEQGMLHYHKKDYVKAASFFEQAIDFFDQLYTKSISKKLKSSFFNSNFDDFTGGAFEVSMLYYYKALSYYQLAQVSELTTRKMYLDKMRASVVGWDTFFKTLARSERKKNEIFVDDFFARIAGANLHELMNKRRDREIAYLLYQDGLKILKRVGPTLKVYNEKYRSYVKALLNKNKKEKKQNQKMTLQYQELISFLQEKILLSALKVRPKALAKWRKQFGYKKSDISKLRKKSKKVPVKIMLDFDYMPEKIPNEVNFSLRGAYEATDDPGTKALIAGIGLPILTAYAGNSLGFSNMTYAYRDNIYVHHNAVEHFVGDLGVAFDLPAYPEQTFNLNHKISIWNQKNKKVLEKPLVLAGPLFDLAKQDLEQGMSREYFRTGVRVAIKTLASIVAAYNLYKASQKNEDTSGLGAVGALAGMFAIKQGVQASEKADLRNWATLPAHIFTTEVYLDPGTYQIKTSQNGQVIKLGDLVVTKNSPAIFSAQYP